MIISSESDIRVITEDGDVKESLLFYFSLKCFMNVNFYECNWLMFISIPPRTQAPVMTASVASSHRLNAPLHPSSPYHSISLAAPRLSPPLKFKSYSTQRGKFISQHLNTLCTSGTLALRTPPSNSSLGVHCPMMLTWCASCKWKSALYWPAWLNKGQFYLLKPPVHRWVKHRLYK